MNWMWKFEKIIHLILKSKNKLLQLKHRLYLKQISIFQTHKNYNEIQRIQDEKKIKELEALIQLNEINAK